MDIIIFTNNPQVNDKYSKKKDVVYKQNQTSIEVLKSVRDFVHLGHALITNPVAGNILPNETPYETVVVSKSKSSDNLKSIYIIEESIRLFGVMIENRMKREYSEKILQDFQFIDLELLDTAIAD